MNPTNREQALRWLRQQTLVHITERNTAVLAEIQKGLEERALTLREIERRAWKRVLTLSERERFSVLVALDVLGNVED